MDYSGASAQDDFAEQSPWGSSSPKAFRPATTTTAPDSPSTPVRHGMSDSVSSLPGPAIPTTESSQDSQGSVPDEVATSSNGLARDSSDIQTAQTQSPRSDQGQPKPTAARYHGHRQHQTQTQLPTQKIAPLYRLTCKVTALERSGRKDPVLRFDVYTNLPKFRTTQFRDVRRTHGEFVKLQEHLISSNPEAIVPAVPPALTSAGAGTTEDETRVKTLIQRWLNTVCSNDVLIRDEEMIFFVEADFGYSPVVRMKQPATGVRRKVIKQFAPPPDDTPELHYARPVVKAFYLGTLDAAQRLDKVVKARRALGLAESSLGEKLASMNVQENHPGLAHAYRKLGRIIQNTGDYHAAQGTGEATTLGDALQYHSADAFIVKETLTNRHILLRELLQAEQARRTKENAVVRMKASSSVKREKVDQAISELDEAASAESYLRGKTTRVTQNLLVEKRKWFDRTTTDILSSVREYVLRQIETERRMLATLESVRPDIRSIDASGGLSRLGREQYPTVRKISLAASQTSRGDAWSGVQRSREALTRSLSGNFAGGIPEVTEVKENGDGGSNTGRPRSGTSATGASLGSIHEDDGDADRVDAKNAASRLAQSTF